MTTSLFGDSTVSFGLNVLLLLKLIIRIRGSHLLELTCERGGMFTGLQVTLTFHIPGSVGFLMSVVLAVLSLVIDMVYTDISTYRFNTDTSSYMCQHCITLHIHSLTFMLLSFPEFISCS